MTKCKLKNVCTCSLLVAPSFHYHSLCLPRYSLKPHCLYRCTTQSTYTGQPSGRGDGESYASLGYGEADVQFKDLRSRSSKPLIVREDGTCVGRGDLVLRLWNPVVLAVGAFRRSDDATHVEGLIQTKSEEAGPAYSYLHRKAGNGFRPHHEDWTPQVHRVFIYILFFDSLIRDGSGKVVGGVINGNNFLFAHDTRARS